VPSIEFFFAASGAVDLEIGRAMNTEHERKHLAQADRHIAELKRILRVNGKLSKSYPWVGVPCTRQYQCSGS
jgi:hypothetical protein